jgi:hypothetical protein
MNELTMLYGVATKALNQAVKRNIERIPERYMFQLNKDDVANMWSQIVTGTLVLAWVDGEGGWQH